jgi:hypothetical protein
LHQNQPTNLYAQQKSLINFTRETSHWQKKIGEKQTLFPAALIQQNKSRIVSMPGLWSRPILK